MSSKIHSADSMCEAAQVIRDFPLILIVGNQVHPVPLDDYRSLLEKLRREAGKPLTQDDLEPTLFRQYERFRLITSNGLPHYNYVCLLRLITRMQVRAVVTTNFDNYLSAVLSRYGESVKGIMNPCIPKIDGTTREWCCDGYYSPLTSSPSEVPIWKIHGDLGFARMIDCTHVFALPKFTIEPPVMRRGEPDCPTCCHFIVLREDGSRFKSEAKLSLVHPSYYYKHNIDFWFSDGLFYRERDAAARQLHDHCEGGGAVFVVGMKFNPKFGEDLLDILLDLPRSTPIIYLVASKGREITGRDSDLLDGLASSHRAYILINEVNDTGAIEDGLVDLLHAAGEEGIDAEYTKWRNDNKWWQWTT